MRSLRLAAWAPGISPRPILRTQSAILRDLFPQATRSFYSAGDSIGTGRLYSTASGTLRNHTVSFRSAEAPLLLRQKSPQYSPYTSQIVSQVRLLCSTPHLLQAKPSTSSPNSPEPTNRSEPEKEEEDKGFELSERAAQAAQVDLRAKLAKDGASGKKSGFDEIWRLFKVARPEAKWLGFAFSSC
ncbi:hypothetical protein N7526_008227 [Penicillium atrosanguineum]|nr:hypothetical protein N7526_008227 [Penicillium atrosanguineum]